MLAEQAARPHQQDEGHQGQRPAAHRAGLRRADAEAAAAALEADPATEALTFSILEEDEDRDVWRIDAFPNEPDEQAAIDAVLAGFPTLRVVTEVLADADWLAMALSGLPPVRAGRFFVYGAHDGGLAPASTVNLRIEAGAVAEQLAQAVGGRNTIFAPRSWPSATSRSEEPARRRWLANC